MIGKGFVSAAWIGNAWRGIFGSGVWLAIIAGLAVAQSGHWLDSRGRIDDYGIDARTKNTRAYTPGERAADAEEIDMASTPNYWLGNDGAARTAGSWSQGSAPGDGDIAIWTGVRSNMSVMSGLSGGADGGDQAVIRDDFYGNIGGPGNFYTHLLNCSQFTIRGQGSYFLEPQGTATVLIVDTPHGEVHLGGATVRDVHIKSGTVRLGGTAGFNRYARVNLYGHQSRLFVEA